MTPRGAFRLAAATPALLVVAMSGARTEGASARRPEPDTLTAAYDVSGVRVIQRINPANDILAVRLYLLGGTRQLTERSAGVEALLLEASEYGTAQFPGLEARRAMSRTGAVLSLEPDADWTVFGFTGLVADVDSTWHVFAERVVRPTLSAEAVAQARGKLQTLAHRRYTEPDERIMAIALRALFPGHPYSLDPRGTEASLAALTVDDLKAYHREQIVTSRMLLTVVGNVTRMRVESLVTATLGQLPRGAYHWTLPSLPDRRHAAWLVDNRATATAYLLGLFAGPPPTDRGYWAFRVATRLLSSHLHEIIRTERSLSYAAYAPYLERAIPVGGAYVSTPKPDVALPLIIRAIEDLESRPLDPLVLWRFIDSFKFDYLAENATAANQADFLARAELYLGGFRKGEEFLSRLQSVSPIDVTNVAAQYMTAGQYAYLGDTARMRGKW